MRTAWLFGPRGTNFVTKILAAAQRSQAGGRPLRVVADEWGNPTPTPWLAGAIRASALATMGGRLGVRHLVGMPPASRAEWARYIVRTQVPEVVSTRLADYQRASNVPRRAILHPSAVRGLDPSSGDWRSATDALVASAMAP